MIGVSPNPSFVNAILNSLVRWQYAKPIYPVNPKARVQRRRIGWWCQCEKTAVVIVESK
jgi:hypothetical protein